MKTLFAVLMLAGSVSTFAQHEYVVKKFDGKVYVVPKLIKMKLVESIDTSQGACDNLKYYLQSAVTDYEKVCKDQPNSSDCKKLTERVVHHAKHSGPVSNWMTLKIDDSPITQALSIISAEHNVSVDDIVIRSPKSEELLKNTTFILDRGHEMFFENIIRTFKFKMDITLNKTDGIVRVSNDLEYCALKENELSFSGSHRYSLSLKTPIPAADIKGLFDTYQAVAADYEKNETVKWENPLHKVLYIGVSLQKHAAEKKSPISDLGELFKIFFTHYESDNSIYLDKYTIDQIAEKLTPARQDTTSVIIKLVQE